MTIQELIGRRVRLAGHFPGTVLLEAAEPLDDGAFKLRVRTDSGTLDETLVTADGLHTGVVEPIAERHELVPGDDLFDLVEARRIELAYAHDPTFAVSLSGIRGLPHQIDAVYRHMLPQARLRFVLADDPGAGKTIMAGLLMKELHLRGVADRVSTEGCRPWYARRSSRSFTSTSRSASRRQRLRAVAQALQGPALRDGGPSKPAEAQACDFAEPTSAYADLAGAVRHLLHMCSFEPPVQGTLL